MSWPAVELQEFCRTGSGTTPSRKKPELFEGAIPWVKSGELRENEIFGTEEHVSEEALRSTSLKMVPAGALLVAMYGATVGRVGLLGIEATTNQAVCHVVPDPEKADRRYMFHLLQARAVELVSKGVGGAQPNISQGTIKQLKIPLPPLEEQRRIAEILDQADALRRHRTRALEKLNTLGQAIFHEMFGDPATNPRRWPCRPVGDAVAKISDGPFGSNLKSEHYVESGIRVWRLQNIGVGEVIDLDRAYISEEHFRTLKKHECLPGDVIVGTLGDPNLRACIQPNTVPVALNKADCVQIRPDDDIALAEYWIGLLNHPSTLKLAHSAVLGQTRARISMGRLRNLSVPIPTIEEQREYETRLSGLRNLRKTTLDEAEHGNQLFASLQSRAFRGEL